jgi:hypothetical protein
MASGPIKQERPFRIRNDQTTAVAFYNIGNIGLSVRGSRFVRLSSEPTVVEDGTAAAVTVLARVRRSP